jgi:hypothetical protein
MRNIIPLSPMSFRFAFVVWTVLYVVVLVGQEWTNVKESAGSYQDLRPVKQLLQDRVKTQRQILSVIDLYSDIAREAESEKNRLWEGCHSDKELYQKLCELFQRTHIDGKLPDDASSDLRSYYRLWEKAYLLGTKQTYLKSWLDQRRREDILGELDVAITDIKYEAKMGKVIDESDLKNIWKRLEQKRFETPDITNISKSELDKCQREALRWIER